MGGRGHPESSPGSPARQVRSNPRSSLDRAWQSHHRPAFMLPDWSLAVPRPCSARARGGGRTCPSAAGDRGLADVHARLSLQMPCRDLAHRADLPGTGPLLLTILTRRLQQHVAEDLGQCLTPRRRSLRLSLQILGRNLLDASTRYRERLLQGAVRGAHSPPPTLPRTARLASAAPPVQRRDLLELLSREAEVLDPLLHRRLVFPGDVNLQRLTRCHGDHHSRQGRAPAPPWPHSDSSHDRSAGSASPESREGPAADPAAREQPLAGGQGSAGSSAPGSASPAV